MVAYTAGTASETPPVRQHSSASSAPPQAFAIQIGAFPPPERMKTASPSRAGGNPSLCVARGKPGFKRPVKRKYPPILNQKHLSGIFTAEN